MPSRAFGLISCTAWASTCAAECRSTARPSGSSMVTASTTAPSASGEVQVAQLAVDADDDDVTPGGVQVGTRRPRLHRGRDPVDGEGDELGHRYSLLRGRSPWRRATRCYRRARRASDLICTAGGAGPWGRPLLIEWAIPDSNR